MNFDILFCFCMLVNEYFIYLGCVYLRVKTVLWCEAFGLLFLCGAEGIGGFSDLRWCAPGRWGGFVMPILSIFSVCALYGLVVVVGWWAWMVGLGVGFRMPGLMIFRGYSRGRGNLGEALFFGWNSALGEKFKFYF